MRYFTNGTWEPRSPQIDKIATPVGEKCLACGREIEAEDCGISMIHMDATVGQLGSEDAYRPWHLACFRRGLGIEDVQA